MAQPTRVLVTRAAHQNSALADRLRALGLEPVLVPVIAIHPPSSYAPLDAALRSLEGYGWIVFSSANAVPAFAERLNGLPLPAGLQVAAIGISTARALEEAGFAVDLLPPQAVAESLAETLVPFARQGDGSAMRFLVLRAEEGRDVLVERLQNAGADVTLVPAYRNTVPPGAAALLRQVVQDADTRLRAITFTSSSTARNLAALCEVAAVPLPETALRISIGPITSATLRELGWPPHAEAPEATMDALAQTVASALLD